MAEHPAVSQARAYLDTYGQGDLEALRAFFVDDVVWHVGGNHPLSGDYRGKESLFAYLRDVRESTGGSLALTPEAVLGNDRHVAMFVRVQGERNDKTLDVSMAEMVTVAPDGRWSEFWAMADDQDAVDAFWS